MDGVNANSVLKHIKSDISASTSQSPFSKIALYEGRILKAEINLSTCFHGN